MVTVTTTSSRSISHPRIVAFIARARACASRHAAAAPAGSRTAAATAARSAAAWARCRAATADPSQTPPSVTVTRAATRTVARTVTAPESSPTGLCHLDRLAHNDDPGQHRRAATDPGEDVGALAAQFHRGSGRGQTAHSADPAGIAPCGQPGDFPRRIDTADLQGEGRESGNADQQDRDKTRDRQRCLNRAESAIAG